MLSKGILRQYYAAFSCHGTALVSGIAFYWITPIMVWLLGPESQVPMTYSELGWIMTVIEIGDFFAPIPSGLLANRYGRKWPLMIGFLVMTISWIVLVSTRSIVTLILARFLQGVGIGISATLNPIYVAEIAENSRRGEFCAHFKTFVNIGALLAWSIGPFVSYEVYIYSCMIPTVIFALLFASMPESPFYLILSDRREEAIASLSWLRGGIDVTEEARQIEQAVMYDMRSSKISVVDLFNTEASRNAIFIVSVVCFTKYIGGSTTVGAYLNKLISESTSAIKPEIATIIIGIILVITTAVGARLTDSIGRRPLLLFSTFGMSLSAFTIAFYMYLESYTLLDLTSYHFLLYVCFIAFCLATSIGVNPIIPALQTEYFTTNTRGAAGTFINCISTIFLLFSLKVYQMFDEYFGLYSNFILFGVVSIIGFVIILATVSETAQKPLGAIQKNPPEKILHI